MPVTDHSPARLRTATVPRGRPDMPLQGVTILAVEDSRFASESLRLLCLRCHARLRRAETLEQAGRHLSVYRPDVVIVDLGLPDGDGADLIRRLAQRRDPAMVLLGTSGDPAGQALAMAAGAAGFLPKPIESLLQFQAAILAPMSATVPQAEGLSGAAFHPDRFALHDDLLRAADLLQGAADPGNRRYVTGFLGSLARSAQDMDLAQAAGNAADTPLALPHLAALVSARLAAAAPAFAAAETASSPLRQAAALQRRV